MKNFFTLFAILVITVISTQAQNPFGDGSDGALTVNEGETLTINTERTAVTGINSVASPSILVDSVAGIQAGDEVLIISMTDPETDMNDNIVGQWETHIVASVGVGVILLETSLMNNFDDTDGKKHQVVRIPQYADVNISGTLTCTGWDGNTGGILYFRSNGAVTVSATGIITSTGKGYRGGTQFGDSHGGGQGGESFVGAGGAGGHYTADPHGKVGAGGGGAAYNGYAGGAGIAGGGGGATNGGTGLGSAELGGAGGGGGGHAGSAGGAGYGTFGYGAISHGGSNNGQNGGENFSGNGGNNTTGGGGGGGGTYGSTELTKIYLGSGGGCGGRHSSYSAGFGGNGGGFLYVSANMIDCDGLIESNGGSGGNGPGASGGGGGASGGSVFLEALSIDLSNMISSSGGTGGVSAYGYAAGDGGDGRIRLNSNNYTNSGEVSPDPYLGQYVNIIHVQLSNTNDLTGPYLVEAIAIDNEGDQITDASLFYRTNGGAFNEVAMTEIGTTQEFTANIPGQSINTTIDYYLTASDGTDNYILPLAAPTELFSFEVTGYPPYGLISTDNNDGTVDVNWIEPIDLTNFVDYSVYRSEQDGFTPGEFNLLEENVTDTSFVDVTVQDFHTYYYIVSANYNYSGTPVESFSGQTAGLLVDNTSQTTVLGYAFLEARNNHANIKVNFVPLSPSAVADSIYTNALGYFETHDLFPGVYNVRFSKVGFQTPIIIENLTIVEDTDLGESMLYDLGTTVVGDVSGVWSEFVSVSGNITVPAGDSLIIEAGTVVRFLGQYHFYVYGYLASNGTVDDGVLITSGPANQVQARNQWYGMDFYDSSDDNSYLHYTTVEYVYDGIYLEWASPDIENSLIQECSHYGFSMHQSEANLTSTTIQQCSDRGIHLNYSSPMIDNCEIMYCTNNNFYLQNHSNPTISFCSISNSNNGIYARSNSNPFVDGCTISNISTDGIYFYQIWSRGLITNNTFINNNKGIFLNYQSSPQIKGNLFIQNNYGIEYYYNCDSRVTENRFINNSYGIVFNTSSHYCETTISKNVFAYNVNDGIHKNCHNNGDTPTITYNTIFGNGGDGIDIRKPGTETISNNNITDNGGWGLNVSVAIETFENNNLQSNAAGEISNLGYMPSETWNFVSTNPNNNATCDIYRNINEDPMYVLSDTLDFNLQNGSLCIDGGSESVTDPDGSVSDIGRFPFDKGNPHQVLATGFGNQMVSLAWDEINNDSLVEYNVYFKVADADPDFALFGSTSDTTIDVTGLTNNTLYDFTVTGSYPAYESIYAPSVSERPGVPELAYDPGSYSLVVPAAEDSIVENFTLTNSGSRDLHASFPGGNSNSSCAYFDGSGDRVSYGYHGRYHGMSALTLECWLYRQNNGHFEFMGKNYRNYQFAINGSNNVYFYKGYGNPESNNNQAWNTGYYINANQWYHLAMTWEGNTLKLYVNGEHVWTATNAYSSPIPDFIGYPFELGRRAGENSYYLNGKMAEAKLWNVARTQEEIQSYLYQSLRGDEDGLIGYWPLQDDFDDHSQYGATGTVSGETHLQSVNQAPYVLYSIPQSNYTVAPGDSEIIPITFYNRDDMSSIFFTTPLFSNDFDEPEVEIEVALQFGETVPATPVHFIPVPETGKPYTLVIKDAKIDGVTIDVGDEIGVFDGELCVGAGIYDGTFNFLFTAWESDPGEGLDGFTAGNDMIFKMYDTSADLETNEAEEVYFIGDDTFGYGTFSALSLEASVYNFQNVAVTGGQFNLVSFNLLPHYPDAWEVFGDLNDLQIVYNDDGGVLIPGYNINTIGDINFLDGFYLFTDDNTTIEFEGTYIHMEDWGITVAPSKWNYISVLSQDPVPVVDVFSGLDDEVSIVQAATGASWIPGEGVNTIGNMQPGLGYKIALAVDTAVTFNYPANTKSATIPLASTNKQKDPTDSGHFTFTETGLPYAVVVKIKSPKESPYNLVSGDEVGIFDGNLCVGAAVYEGGDQLLVTAWEKDDSQDLPGFTTGQLLRAKIYKASFGYPTHNRVLNVSGTKPYFGEGNYANVVLEVMPLSIESFKFEVLPNPFKDNTDVKFSLQKEDVVKVNVFDGSGRLVKSITNQRYSADQHQIHWNGTDLNGKKLDPGIYFVIAETTENVYTEKVIILK